VPQLIYLAASLLGFVVGCLLGWWVWMRKPPRYIRPKSLHFRFFKQGGVVVKDDRGEVWVPARWTRSEERGLSTVVWLVEWDKADRDD
jgi:hypothetical protein